MRRTEWRIGGARGRKKRTIVNNMRAYDALRSDPSLDTCILAVGDGVALSYKRTETEMDP